MKVRHSICKSAGITLLSRMIPAQFFLAISITGNEVFELGETSRVRCSTPVLVESMRWLDESNRVVREGASVQELVLSLTITAPHNNTRYTCRVCAYGGTRVSLAATIITGRKYMM